MSRSLMNIDIKSLCRLCIVKPEEYEDSTCNETLKEKIRSFFKIDLNTNDKLSNIVCCSCLQIIDNFSNYCERVAENQEIFLQKLTITNEFETSTSSVISGDYIKADDNLDRLDENSANENDAKCDEFIKKNAPPKWTGRKRKPPIKKQECNRAREHKLDKIVNKPKRTQTERDHDERIEGFMTLSCDKCEKSQVFDSVKDLYDHFKCVHQTRGYLICCNKKFYRKYLLASHIAAHINPEAYKCEQCGKNSKSKSLLETHMKVHLPIDQREHVCPTCNQRFATKSHLAQHKNSHLPDSKKKFPCDECDKAFGTKNARTQHKLIHSSQRNFVCEDCGQSFIMKASLQYHIKNIHSNEPKLQCEVCQSWFKNKRTLGIHVRHHYDQTEYKCEHCGKIFARRNVLKEHVRLVHTDIRPHECNLCDRKFKRRQLLNEHIARHTGQPLYTCQYCSGQFKERTHFWRHRKKCELLVQEKSLVPN